MSIWDDPSIRPTSDYVKFENPGDSVSGEVVSLGLHTFEDGKRVPKLIIATADGDVTLTAGQQQLMAKLTELRPEVGDNLTVTYVRSEKRAGGKTLKHFEIKVIRATNSGKTAADLF